MNSPEAVAAIKAANVAIVAERKQHADEMATANAALDQAQVSMKAAAERIAALEAQVASATASVPDDLAAEIANLTALISPQG